jgi:nifR3 family TIM-barrel protein
MSNFLETLPKPFLALAPMEDVTDYVFREIVAEIGKPDLFFTEFTNTDGLFSDGEEHHMQRLKISERQHPIVAQIWGTNPETFEKAARLIVDSGFDGIDLNMGCPARAIMKLGGGSALINNFDLVEKLILSVKKSAAGEIPISVKTRLGIDTVDTEEWISFLLRQNLDLLTVHLRTAKQQSKGKALWDEMTKIIKLRDEIAPDTLIMGNGDVKSIEEANIKYDEYGADGIMVGRGIFTNPWIFSKNPQKHTKEEYIDLLKKHSKLFVETWGSNKNYEIMKKFFKVYVRGFKGAAEKRAKLMTCKSHEEMLDLLKD